MSQQTLNVLHGNKRWGHVNQSLGVRKLVISLTLFFGVLIYHYVTSYLSDWCQVEYLWSSFHGAPLSRLVVGIPNTASVEIDSICLHLRKECLLHWEFHAFFILFELVDPFFLQFSVLFFHHLPLIEPSTLTYYWNLRSITRLLSFWDMSWNSYLP